MADGGLPGTVVSVFGSPGAQRALVEVDLDVARDLFDDGALGDHHPTRLIEAVRTDLEALRLRDAALADSALAASALALAYEIEHPYNSATSKSMCVREMREVMDRLRELAPTVAASNPVDELRAARSKRRARASAS